MLIRQGGIKQSCRAEVLRGTAAKGEPALGLCVFGADLEVDSTQVVVYADFGGVVDGVADAQGTGDDHGREADSGRTVGANSGGGRG